MRAIVVERAGGAGTLEYLDTADPRPEDGDLMIEVEAAGLNFIDIYQRSGLYPMEFPFTPGLEGAGTVAALGQGVDGFRVGDRVAWANVIGSYAERHVVPAERAVPLPGEVDSRTAAAVLLQGLTAHYLTKDTFPLAEGDTCLVHAGAGGVGLLLTQIAKRRGARVITTVSTEVKAETSRRAGADDVIVYTRSDFKDAVEDLVGPNALDVVFDGVGEATFEKGIDLLRPRGMMVTFGNSSGPVPAVSPMTLMQKGSLFLTRPTLGHYLRTREELLGRASDLFAWIVERSLDVTIGAEYPLAAAAAAHRALESRETTGKVLLLPGLGSGLLGEGSERR